jgi:ribonuclease HI
MTSSFPIFFWVCEWRYRHTRNIASTAWVIYQFDEVVSSGGICLGPATNNMAEYHAVIELVTQASSLGISRIIVYLDSQLVVYQLNHIYAIRSPILLCLHLQVRLLE